MARTSGDQAAKAEDSVPGDDYLAYMRSVPPPFYRFMSGHFPPGIATGMHSHPCVAVHGCLHGTLDLRTPSGDERLDAGVFCLIAPGVEHGWHNPGRHTGATFGLLIDAASRGHWPAAAAVETSCRELAHQVTRLHRFSTAGDPELQAAFWLAADHLTSEEHREPVALSGALLSFLGLLVARLRGAAVPRGAAGVAQQIRRLLLARVNDRVRLAEVARAVHVSPTRAKEAFRAAFGCGIIAYANQLKVWRAQRLLCDPTLTVEQICYRLGFSNPAYFTRVFRRLAGETPTEFRHRGYGES
jgi:AraC-like DNA-binding protein/quercetin dioxygenase-like cupin family protein